MFIVLQHRITNPQTAFARGQNLLDGNGAPQGTHVLQFYPSRDRNSVFCLWESNSVEELRGTRTQSWATRARIHTSRSMPRSPAGYQSSSVELPQCRPRQPPGASRASPVPGPRSTTRCSVSGRVWIFAARASRTCSGR